MNKTLRFGLVGFFLCLVISIGLLPAGSFLAEAAFGFIREDSSWCALSYEDMMDMDAQVACYARHEIYARNGGTFASAELQAYFDQQFWYSPVYGPDQFPEDVLNAYETANIALLAEREADMGGYRTDQPGYSYEPVYTYLQRKDSEAVDLDYTVDPDTYIFYDSDRRYLSEADLSGLSAQELCYARNEIYARHGLLFSSWELSDYFGQKNWYWGYLDQGDFSAELLSDCEQANVMLLKEWEEIKCPGGYQLDGSFTYAQIGSYTGAYSYEGGAGDYLFPESNSRYLTYQDLEGLSLKEICYARNEIYARRGYIFQSQELRDYFGAKVWYHGTVAAGDFSSGVFNPYEMANVELLKGYEYALNPRGYQLY